MEKERRKGGEGKGRGGGIRRRTKWKEGKERQIKERKSKKSGNRKGKE
jgi:hypothetical protein